MAFGENDPGFPVQLRLALTNTHILVGNSSNIATDVPVSQDATISNTGAMSVTGLNGVGANSANAIIAARAYLGC